MYTSQGCLSGLKQAELVEMLDQLQLDKLATGILMLFNIKYFGGIEHKLCWVLTHGNETWRDMSSSSHYGVNCFKPVLDRPQLSEVRNFFPLAHCLSQLALQSACPMQLLALHVQIRCYLIDPHIM
jgi:hypothetical protein